MKKGPRHDPDDNHFNFSCRLGSSTEYWVSVHSVGRGSRQLLDAMVRELRPVSRRIGSARGGA